MASSTPATSAKVTLGVSLLTILGRALPKLITRLPPPWAWFMKKAMTAMMSTNGAKLKSSVTQRLSFWLSTGRWTPPLITRSVISSV